MEIVKTSKAKPTFKVKFVSDPIKVSGGYVVEYQYRGAAAGQHMFLDNDARIKGAGYASAYEAALDVASAMKQNMADDAIVRA